MGSEPGIAPVFLVGAARSGTSLLFRTLALHPDATWLSNWVQRFPAAPQLTLLNGVCRAFPGRRARVWFGAHGDNAYVYGARRPWRDRLFPQPVEAETLYRQAGVPELGAEPGEQVPEDVVAELRRRLRVACRWDRRQVHVAKRIANNRRIPLLLQAFPEARFVEIVRDGRAVAASLSKVDWWAESEVWWYGGNPESWREDGGNEWALCARNWVEEVRAVREGLQLVAPDRVLSISYEELVSRPRETLDRVAGFSGLDPTSRTFHRALAQVRFPNKNDRWRADLDPRALATVEQIQHSELVHYGYQPITGPSVGDSVADTVSGS